MGLGDPEQGARSRKIFKAIPVFVVVQLLEFDFTFIASLEDVR
jgi:hypothetical protein